MEEKNTQVPLGTIEIAPEVIEMIAGIAASKIEGFHASNGKIVSSVNTLLGKANYSRGVTLSDVDGEYVIDLYGSVDYGVSVPKLAFQIQEHVKEQLLFSCELEIREVNVHIQSIIPVKSHSEELFELGDDE